MLRSLPLFVAEAVVEGAAACLSSGTDSAYLYAVYGRENYLAKTAHAANFGTAGFLISTAGYAVLYQIFGLTGLLTATVVSLFASSVLAAIGVGWCFALCGALLLSGALVLCRSPRVSPAA